jgi:cell wall-associated NlpC family hydrolase
MREKQVRRSILPLSALMTAGALVLTQAPDATAALAATATTEPSLNEDPVPGEVAATATETDTERSTQTRSATVVATKKLTRKVKATGRATGKATRSAKATRTVTVTRYAPSYDEALAEASGIAEQAAHDRAAAAAKSRAGKLALAQAKKAAKGKARHRAEVHADAKFGHLVVRRAWAERGKPYRWGAQGPNAFDCSGLVRYVMKGVGVKGLPRTSDAMSHKAERISKKHKRIGDLIFFGTGRHVYHVGMYAGHGMMWHSPGSGRHVQKVHIWTSSYRVGRLV